MNARQNEKRLKHFNQKLLADPAERETGECHAQLCRRKERIEMTADVFAQIRPQIPLIHQLVELTNAHFYNGEFASYEKTIENDQHRDGGEFRSEEHTSELQL